MVSEKNIHKPLKHPSSCNALIKAKTYDVGREIQAEEWARRKQSLTITNIFDEDFIEKLYNSGKNGNHGTFFRCNGRCFAGTPPLFLERNKKHSYKTEASKA